MIQSGVLRIFRMAVRGVCSLSALPVCFVSLLRLSASSLCFVSLLVRPALSALSCSVRSSIRPFVHSFGCSVSCSSVLSALSVLSCSVLFCPVLSCSVRSSIRPFVHSFGCFASCPSVLSARPTVRLSVCPFVRLFRLLFICSVCSSIRLLCLSVSPLIRVRPFCPLCLSALTIYLPVPLRSRRILFRRFRQVFCFFSAG